MFPDLTTVDTAEDYGMRYDVETDGRLWSEETRPVNPGWDDEDAYGWDEVQP